jgi:hypothetical protein
MSNFKSAINNIYHHIVQWIHPVVGFPLYAAILFLVMFAAHKLLIANLGFYYDDWEGVLLQKQLFSFPQIWRYFLIDRPFSSIIHFLLNPLLGTKPIIWHLVGLLINWTAVLFVVKSFLRLWPKYILEIGWIGLLLGVYPGITRQFVIRTSMVHYVSFLFFSISIWLMIKAVQNQKHRWTFLTLSLSLALLQMLIIEYFTGLELIRVLILYYIYKRENTHTIRAIKKAFLNWLPYLLVFILFFSFRMVILPLIQQEGMIVKNTPWILSAIQQNPLDALVQQVEIILQDLVYAVIYVWSQTIIPEDVDIHAKTTILSWLVGFLVAGVSWIFMQQWHNKNNSTASETKSYPILIFSLCLIAMLLGGLPIWVVGRQAIKGLWSSRFLFGIVLGAVPIFVLITSWLFGKKRNAIFSIIMALFLMASVSLQIRTARTYSLTWQYAKDYFWQLKWRAPALVEGTFILSPYTPFQFSSDYQIAYATNVLYATGYSSEEMKYWWFDGPDDIIDFTKNSYPEQMDIDHQFRNLIFKSSMEKALPVIYKPARGCLQVLDNVYKAEPLLLVSENQLFDTFKTGLILNEEQPVPIDIFGKEPEPKWCYIFQLADLARSEQKWDEIVTYWKTAVVKEMKPNYGPEYLPFIEANAHLQEWDQTYTLIEKAYFTTEKMEPFLCSNWDRISAVTENSPEKEKVNNEVQDLLKCNIQP